MCQDCGCGEVGAVKIRDHFHPPGPDHHHLPKEQRSLLVHTSLLAKNDRAAHQNRHQFQDNQVFVINLLSSPGSGKTAILERMAQEIHRPMAAIVGDLETDNDAVRLRRSGLNAVQITTGQACHLEAAMIARLLPEFDLSALDILFIENVGNLVCPAHYDLGESLRVVIFSVTEGEDKPLKYPTMFKTADVVLINKIDIAKVVGFDREIAIANIQRIAPQATLFEVSARSGLGMADWYDYLEHHFAPLCDTRLR